MSLFRINQEFMKIPRQHELFGFKTGGIDTRGAVGYAREMDGGGGEKGVYSDRAVRRRLEETETSRIEQRIEEIKRG